MAGTTLARASTLGSSAAVRTAQAQRQPVGRRPNILVIFGDDIGMWNVGAYCNGMMGRTPNIDRIAKEGILHVSLWSTQLHRGPRGIHYGAAAGEDWNDNDRDTRLYTRDSKKRSDPRRSAQVSRLLHGTSARAEYCGRSLPMSTIRPRTRRPRSSGHRPPQGRSWRRIWIA